MSAGPLVVKVGGATLERAGSLWRDVVALHASRGGTTRGVVLVHGGGNAVDRHLERLGMATLRVEGLRVTPPEQVEEIAGVLAGRTNKHAVGSLAGAGARAVGVCLGDGGAWGIPTRVMSRGVDLGRVGEVSPAGPGSGTLLMHLLAGGFLPVVCSIGLDEDGGFLNVNADDAAAGVASAVGAEALVLVTDVPGVLDARGAVIPTLDEAGIDRAVASGVIHGGMVPKVRAALARATASGRPVIITNADGLGAWSAGKPAGTRVVVAEGSDE